MFGTTTYHQTIRKMVVAFGSLFNNISVKRTNSSGAVIETIMVPVAYGPKQKFMVRINQPNLNDGRPAIILPRIGFQMSQVMYDGTRKLISVNKNASSVSGNYTTQHNPVPYNFIFDLNVLVKNAEDGAQIIEQILPNFTPDFTVTLNMIPKMNIKVDVPIVLNSVNYLDAYDGDFETRRAISWDMQFTMKSFMYPELSTTGKIIKEVQVPITIPEQEYISDEIGAFDRIKLEDSNRRSTNYIRSQDSKGIIFMETSDSNMIGAANTAVIKIAITNDGKAKIRSFPLMIISSKNEPRHEAEIKPKGTPKNNPRPTAIKATDKEVCPPIIIIEKISLPK